MDERNKTKVTAFTLRGIYLAILSLCLFVGKQQHAIAFAGPFIVTLPILIQAKNENKYYGVDAMFTGLFMAAMLMSYFDLWPATSTAFTIDKPFHIIAGACLANFARIYFHKKINDKNGYYLIIISFALLIGAAWEIYEWIGSKLPAPYATPSTGYDDTMMDLIADTIGAAAVAGYAWFCAWKKKEQTWLEAGKIV